MFGKRTIFKDYAGIISQIHDGVRRAPEHKQPASLRGSGWDFLITAAHEVVFEDFRWFGAMLNRSVSEPWSIAELPDVLLGLDEPDLGRRYRTLQRVRYGHASGDSRWHTASRP